MYIKNKNVRRAYLRSLLIYGLGLAMLAAAVLIIVLCVFLSGVRMKNAAPLDTIYSEYYKHSFDDVFASSVEVMGIEPFYRDPNSTKCYDLVWNGENIYVILTSKERETDLIKLTENLSSDTVFGVTKRFSNRNARSAAVGFLNKIRPDLMINDTNLDKYIGGLVLEEEEIKQSNIGLDIFIKFFWVILALVFAIWYVLPRGRQLTRSFKMSKADAAFADAAMENAEWLPTLRAYLCDELIYGMGYGLCSIRYENILMLYKTKSSRQGKKYSISAMHRNGRLISITCTSLFSPDFMVEDELRQTEDKLRQKNPEAHIGYSSRLYTDNLIRLQKAGREQNKRSG